MDPRNAQRRGGRGWRVAFRCVRITVLGLILLLALFALWANYVRVPGFITSRVKSELRQHNLALDFSRLRLKGMRRLVAEDLSIDLLNTPNGAAARISDAELIVDYGKLFNGEIRLSGLKLEGGALVMPLNAGADSPEALRVTNIVAEVQFVGRDAVRLTRLSADGFGARISASGTVRHLSKFKTLHREPSPGGVPWQKQLADVLQLIESIQFGTPPELRASFFVDGSSIADTRANLTLKAGRTVTPWNQFEQLRLASGIVPRGTNQQVKALLNLDVVGLRSREDSIQALHMTLDSAWTPELARLLTNRVTIKVTQLESDLIDLPTASLVLVSSQETPGAEITSKVHVDAADLGMGSIHGFTNLIDADITHPLPFPSPAALLKEILTSQAPDRQQYSPQTIAGKWRASSGSVQGPNFQAENVALSGGIITNELKVLSGGDLSFWAKLAPYGLQWKGGISNASAAGAPLGPLDLEGDWSFPLLSIRRLSGKPYEGSIESHAELNVETGMATLNTEAQFDYKRAAAHLSEAVQKAIEPVSWDEPPRIRASLMVQLPKWTERWTNLSERFQSTAHLSGVFSGAGAYRGIPFENIEGQIGLTGSRWNISDLTITRPDGQAFIDCRGDLANQDFHCKLDSQLNPGFIKDFLPKEQQIAFEVVKFVQPPVIHGELRGNFEHPERLTFKGSLAAGSFFVKEQAFSDVSGDITYTNLIVEAANVVVHRGKEALHIPYIRADIPGEVMFVTNGVSTIDPWVAMSLVGEDAYDAIDPYRFGVSPTVKINGNVPLRHWSKANLHFQVAGNEFTFWKFHIPSVTGDVFWKADHLNISNVVANFYGGEAHWSGAFFIEHHHSIYSFTGTTTNSDVQQLVRDVFSVTNQIQGTLSGTLIVTSADSANPKSWNGYGDAALRDGFLWEVPVFGVFSPIIDSIAPGLGSNPISSGGGSFQMTNSVIYTRDMQVRAPAFRLDYRGKVDSDGNLDALVEAEILRDTWIVGKLFSVALWPVAKAFEARVTGTVQEPKTKPRFFPKFMFAPFKVLNAIGDAVKDKGRKPGDSTEAPPPPVPQR